MGILTLKQPSIHLLNWNFDPKCGRIKNDYIHWLLWNKWYQVSIVAADDLVLKHQVISSHNADQRIITPPGVSTS